MKVYFAKFHADAGEPEDMAYAYRNSFAELLEEERLLHKYKCRVLHTSDNQPVVIIEVNSEQDLEYAKKLAGKYATFYADIQFQPT